MRNFVLGIVFTIVVAIAAGLIAVFNGLIPANADGPILPGEKFVAQKALNAAIHRQMIRTAPPIQPTSENIIAGIKLYGVNCIVCHGSSQGEQTNIERGFYQDATIFAKHGVTDDPEGETFWKIQHGIRWTAMPSFGKSLDETQMWQLTLFLKHMDQLPPDAQAAWKGLKQPMAYPGQPVVESAAPVR